MYLWIIVIGMMLCGALYAGAETWTMQWPPAPGESNVRAEVCPLMFGKQWAYAVEIDDGPQSVITRIQPLLAQFSYTDAPPGIPGGKAHPFVGGVGVIVADLNTSNRAHLTWEQLKTLQSQGWAIVNHSYAHAGHSYGNPPNILTPAQFRRDLFWSQTLFAADLGNGRAPSAFIYPNGYMDYSPYLNAFGLRCGSRVAGIPTTDLYADNFNLLDLNRSYLDEGNWTHRGNSDPLFAFPTGDRPAPRELFIDFTHNIDTPDTPNYLRWHSRLTHIAKRFGKDGLDNMWCAPTGSIIDYSLAAKRAKVTVSPGKLAVSLPDDSPASPLTIHLTGLHPQSILTAPPGTLIHRHDDHAWITTPMLGQPGSAPPNPQVKRIYSGPVQNIHWPAPVKIAGVRLMQSAPLPDDYQLSIELSSPGQPATQIVRDDMRRLPKRWGYWWLVPLVPDRDPLHATDLHIAPANQLSIMEVWTLP